MGDYAGFVNNYGGTIAKGVGTAVDAYGQYQVGKDRRTIAKANSQLAEQDAQEVIRRSGADQVRLQQQKRQLIGSQETAIAFNNVTQSGSALDLLSDTEKLFERDANTVRNDAARQAWGIKSQAAIESNAANRTAKNQNAAALSTLATGGIETYDAYQRAKKRKLEP